ncbi:SAM-dependent methyltransferase [Candidatus Micrarchaeota archaeon]|nr:SAM-dependent methyltransferase [Candidatus Micrarchaeota archaeon]
MIYLTRELVEKYKKGERRLSLDLGKSITIITNELEGVPLEEIKGEFVYAWDGKELWKVAVFDNGLYRLRMMKGKPILEIDGLRMHLLKDFEDVLEYSEQVAKKLKIGNQDIVLDTCMGLGYTAIAAAKKARKVVTVELSPAVIAMAKWNPWSQKLFESQNIKIVEEESCSEYIGVLEKGEFTKIIHDPPRFSKAGELYSGEFYRNLRKVCKKGGLLFHYVGGFGKEKRDIGREVAFRLEKSGWKVTRRDNRLQGLIAEAV